MKIQLLKLLVLGVITVFSYNTQAQSTYIVTNKNDSGSGSLRAIAAAAANGDIIRFSPSLLTAAVDSISLSTEINFGARGIVIKGLYSTTDTLFISGGYTSRIFSFNGAGKVVLDSLVLINGNGVGVMENYNGGAILYKNGVDTLHINNSIFSGNRAPGGGLLSYSSSVTINNSTFSGNTGQYGGGVYSLSSSVTINNSTFIGNTADNGGGVYSVYSSSVTINNSTFSGNTAATSGGGISFSSSVIINNSTFSGNIASYSGGGVFASSSSSLSIGSSIFDGSSIENFGTITSNGYNAFSDSPAEAIGTGDLVNQTILLQPLAFNGGATQTMVPSAGSIVINTGNSADISDAQNRPIIGIRDIGAAEYNCTKNITETEVVCGGYSWIDGNTYTVDTTVSFTNFSITGAVCDSTFTLHLSMNINTSVTKNGITLTSNATGATYNWLDCNNANAAISGATSQTFVASANGSYAVEVTQNGCVDTSACYSVTTTSGIKQNGLVNERVELYPNPIKNELTIESQGDINQIEVYNLTGQLLQASNPQSTVIKIDFSAYEQGIYLVKIHTTDGQVTTSRVVKE